MKDLLGPEAAVLLKLEETCEGPLPQDLRGTSAHLLGRLAETQQGVHRLNTMPASLLR